MRTPALDTWRRELESGLRKEQDRDALTDAAGAEYRALEALEEGDPDLAAHRQRDARRIVEEAARREPSGRTDYRALLAEYSSLGARSERVEDVLAKSGLCDLPERAALSDVENALRALAILLNGSDPTRRALVREAAVTHLKRAGITSPARSVDATLGTQTRDAAVLQGEALTLRRVEPWPDPVEGQALLNELAATFKRYVALSDEAATALGLFTMHTYALDAANVSPLLVVQSPQKRCGKTTALSVLGALVARPLLASNVTPAPLFRAIEAYRPTFLIDEADTFLRGNDEMRGLLNSGHIRTGQVIRAVGDDYEPRAFSTWCPKAIALIGELHGTLSDRAIRLVFRRRKQDEKIERLRLDRVEKELEPLRRRARRWALDHLDELRAAEPDVPPELDDRAADHWRPLLAIADSAGGAWSLRARSAALVLSVGNEGELTPAIQLLADIRDLFRSRGADRLASAGIVETLGARDDRPWSEWRAGRSITPNQLARLLKPFGIRPRTVRSGESTFKGYLLADFDDAFARYLPSESSQPEQPRSEAGDSVLSIGNLGGVVTDDGPGKDARHVSPVTDVTDGSLPAQVSSP